MVDILHRVGDQDATPEKVYEALTTVEGLAGWWTDDTNARSTGAGGVRAWAKSSSSGSRPVGSTCR